MIGLFPEGMAIPSLTEILAKRFGPDQIIETKRGGKGADEIELDLDAATLARGICLAQMHCDIFRLAAPPDLQPN